MQTSVNPQPKARKPLYKYLYFQVLTAIILGALVGAVWPSVGEALKPLGDGFVKIIKMMIAPIVFTTVVLGIAKIGDMKKVGRIGIKALLYFEVLSTVALAIGLIVVNVVKPGAGINADLSKIDTKSIATYTQSAQQQNGVDFVMHIIPDSVVDAFAKGDVLQVLFFSVLFGLALARIGARAKVFVEVIDQFSQALFKVIGVLMYLAPVGAFGAMGFTIGKYGLGALTKLGLLMACVYLTCFLFVFVILNLVSRLAGFSLWKFLRYIKEEIFVVLGTSSSETALPLMMSKLEKAGAARSVVGLTIPTGYSFNLDGTSIYLTMAALFIAQATNVHLDLGQQLGIMALLLLTSKGAAAVTGGGFITLAATLSAIGTVPVAGLALLLGIDRFMSEARAITNLIGNGVATIVVAKWEDALDMDQLQQALNGEITPEPERLEAEPEGLTLEASPAA